jgi:hypothetical protein
MMHVHEMLRVLIDNLKASSIFVCFSPNGILCFVELILVLA